MWEHWRNWCNGSLRHIVDYECWMNMGTFKEMNQTYNRSLRQGTPVIPCGNCSKAKSNCIFCCLLSFQCHLIFIVKRLCDKIYMSKIRNLCCHHSLPLLYQIALRAVAVSELAAPLVTLFVNIFINSYIKTSHSVLSRNIVFCEN